MQPNLIVIDTQSLFDWMIFKNPTCTNWGQLLCGGRWEWTFTSDMKAEFDHVAAKGFGERWPFAQDDLASAWSKHGHLVATPEPLGASDRLICTDPDDQKFIDLAIAIGAHTLVSRDKALLKLAGKARARHGLRVCRPEAWPADPAARPTA